MNIQVELQGKEELIKKFDRLSTKVREQINKLVAAAAVNTQRAAKLRVPVRTGALRNSIMVQIDRGAHGSVFATVGAFMPYASYVEHGTRFQKPKPYLMPAYEQNRKWLEQELRRIEREIEQC